MSSRKYRLSSGSGSSDMGVVGRTSAMATSGISPLSTLGVVSPFASLANVPFAEPKRAPRQRRVGQTVSNQPFGRLPPLGGAMGARLERMGALMGETRISTGSSAPIASAISAPTPKRAGSLTPIGSVPTVKSRAEPDMSRRAGSLPPIGNVPSMAKGGKVKKTGLVLLHKGEVVIPKARVASVAKAVKKAGLKKIPE